MTISLLQAQTPGHDTGDLPAVPRVPCRKIPLLDEAELGLRLAEGDPDALDQLVRCFWEPLASYAYRIVGDRDAAMDIAQETCVRIWNKSGRKPTRFLRAYLFRIARNYALDYRKTRQTRSRLLRLYQSHGSGPDTPEDVLEHAHVSEQVELAIQMLPERRREVFVLAYLKGLSYAEVGEVLGISHMTVKNHMSAALAQLRDALRPLIRERQRADLRARRIDGE